MKTSVKSGLQFRFFFKFKKNSDFNLTRDLSIFFLHFLAVCSYAKKPVKITNKDTVEDFNPIQFSLSDFQVF
jgi:hypothetical protein